MWTNLSTSIAQIAIDLALRTNSATVFFTLNIFRQFRFSNVASWKRFITDEIPLDQYRYLESHANGFAGLVLVPAAELRVAFFDYVEKGARTRG